MKSLSRVRLLATPWTAAYQAPPSMGFSRQEYWSGVPLPSSLVWLGLINMKIGNSGHPCLVLKKMLSTFMLSMILTVSLSNMVLIRLRYFLSMGHPGASAVKKLPASAGNAGLISGLGRSPGEGNGIPLQYSSLGNIMARGAWGATVHGITNYSDKT